MIKFLNKGISTPLAITIIIVLAIVLVGGILAYQYWWLPKEEAKNSQKPVACTQEAKFCPDGSTVSRTGPNCEFAECPTVKTDETVDWPTYQNEEYGFEVKHPTNWHLYLSDYGGMNMMIFSDLSEEQQLSTVINSTVEERKNLCELNNFYFLTIRITKEQSGDWLKENKAYMDQFGAETLKEEIIIGNIDGYLVTSETKSGERTFVWVLPRGDNTYLIDSFCPQECRNNWEAGKCKVFTEMLSTFRFIDQLIY